MTSTIAAPTREELIRRAADLVPLMRKHAEWQDENRRIHDEVIEGLADMGFFRMRVPTRFGGFESDTQTLSDVLVELGRGDGSVSWTASVWAIPGWMVGMFPEHVQEEVYSTPNVRVCGTLSPSAMASPADGGMMVSGSWHFISGALHSHWQEIIAMTPTPDGQGMYPVVALVPLSDLQIVDDWHTHGLRASGSVTTIAKDLFVPQERILPMPAVLQGQTSAPKNAKLAMYRNPLLAVANASSVGMMVGMVRGAMDVFLERLNGRGITYTSYEKQSEAPVTHMLLAEATMKLDECQFHADTCAKRVDAKGKKGEAWTVLEKARSRAEVGYIAKLGREAADMLAQASGGTSLYRNVPIQRFAQDLRATSLHAIIVPETNLELYGRILCGQEPNT